MTQDDKCPLRDWKNKYVCVEQKVALNYWTKNHPVSCCVTAGNCCVPMVHVEKQVPWAVSKTPRSCQSSITQELPACVLAPLQSTTGWHHSEGCYRVRISLLGRVACLEEGGSFYHTRICLINPDLYARQLCGSQFCHNMKPELSKSARLPYFLEYQFKLDKGTLYDSYSRNVNMSETSLRPLKITGLWQKSFKNLV